MNEIQRQVYNDLCRFITDLDCGCVLAEPTRLAQNLVMSLGIDSSDNSLVRAAAKKLFTHDELKGEHKLMWKRMVNMITPSERVSCKLELKGYGWEL